MMRGNLIWVVGLSGSNVEFMLDESGEWEVVDGGRITQHQNRKQDSRQLKNRCDVCGEPSTHQAYSGIKGEMAFCCKHHIERGGIPADWHPQCLKYYKEKTESPQAKQSQVESNPEKEVLFTTEDGVKIYSEDERYYVVITKEGFGYEPYSVALLAHGDVYDANYKDACRVFSTKEKAEEYILLNKPVLSLKDIDDLVDDENAWEKAKQIAKEKMKA